MFERKWVRVTGALLLVLVALVGAGAGWIAVDLASRPTPPEPTPEEMYVGEAEPARSTLVQAMHLFRGEKYSQARQLWLPLAEAGNAEAQFRMGRLYTFGHGEPVDHYIASNWYRLAVEQKHPAAMYNLARNLDLGRGGAATKIEAITMFSFSSELNFLPSDMALYRRFGDKERSIYSPKKAFSHLLKAYCGGDHRAGWLVVDNYMMGRYGEKNTEAAFEARENTWNNRRSLLDYRAYLFSGIILAQFHKKPAPKSREDGPVLCKKY